MKGASKLKGFAKAFASITAAILMVGYGVWYTLNNPQSMLSYGFQMFGIDLFEPTYLERKTGEEMGFSLKSFTSRSELDTKAAGFSECEESGHASQAQARQYIINDIHCKVAHHLEIKGRVEVSYFNDRLAAVRFYPSTSVDEYVDAFQKKYRVELKVGTRARLTSNVFVKLDRTKDGFYMEWVDARLEKQNRSWIMKHA